MKTFIFYTDEGTAQSPTGKEAENLQVLGIEKGKSLSNARDNLINNNAFIKELGYSEISSLQLLDDNMRFDINTVIEYLWEDEKKHYEESKEDAHIFKTLVRLKKAIS